MEAVKKECNKTASSFLYLKDKYAIIYQNKKASSNKVEEYRIYGVWI